MELKDIKSVYFLGAGGIGMSALVRYFLSEGKFVAGYDRTPSKLTDSLIEEGAQLHFEENEELIPAECKDPASTLVIYTPAIPAGHKEWKLFREGGFTIKKRAEVLGIITRDKKGVCAAGTHGKTTTSTMTAHLLHQSSVDCAAFLGGISKNYKSNLILSDKSDLVVIEADEYDRSFLHLEPYIATITSADPDHLDIYGNKENYLEAFAQFTEKIRPDGYLIIHEGLEVKPRVQEGVKCFVYGRENGDFHAENIRIGGGTIIFDYVSPWQRINDVELGVPVSINIDNGIASMAMAEICGASAEELKEGMKSFAGADRRFDFHIKENDLVLLSDYAHHPDELRALLKAARSLPHKRLICAFQPHTYTRTAALFDEFVAEMRKADVAIVAEIYAAREKNDSGISSRDLCAHIEGSHYCATLQQVTDTLAAIVQPEDLVLTVGAGDIYRAGEELIKRG